jgi:4-hydroxy-tetrahydrodipicolinate synthase
MHVATRVKRKQATEGRQMDRDQIREALTGPITSIRTPFTRESEIDYEGLRSTLDFNIEAGSKTMLMTAGDSHYIALSDAEIADISKAVVDHVSGRAMVVTADRFYHTRQAVEFARYAKEIGSDLHMVLPPGWAASATPQTLCEHYAQVAEHIPVMVVTGAFSAQGEGFGLDTLRLVRERVQNVAAIKDDMLGPFARKMTLLVKDEWAVFSGGQKQNHLDLHPYGCHGFMSTFMSFKPEVTHRYWSAIQSNDLDAASTVIREFDHPFFELLMKSKGGFDAALHGVFELFDIYERWRPAPYYNLNNEEMEVLKGELEYLKIL